MLVTTFRTEVDYPRIVAYVAWFDHTRTSVAWYPGRYEPPSAPVRGPMSVPNDQRWRLLATFNGGFIYSDGNNGSSIGGRQYEPLKAGLATLVAYRDGRVDVKTWHGGPVAGPQVAFARQSLPLIIDHGRLNPALNDSSQWGYTLGNAVRVWRTGAGIDRHGNLIYAAADYQTVVTLAKILQRAGAVRAMQLDINPEWPTLDHLHPPRRPRSGQGRAELPAAGDPLPRAGRPRLLRRVPAPARARSPCRSGSRQHGAVTATDAGLPDVLANTTFGPGPCVTLSRYVRLVTMNESLGAAGNSWTTPTTWNGATRKRPVRWSSTRSLSRSPTLS